MKNVAYLLVLTLVPFLSSCDKEEPIKTLEGWKPKYFSYDDSTIVKSLPPKNFEKAGKIVAQDDYVFVNERSQGIHVVDKSDPFAPKKIAFWEIPNNLNFIVKNKILYAENGKNLFVIDISNILSIKVVKMIKNVYTPKLSTFFLPPVNGPFECYDAKKGMLLGWEKAKLINPKCRK